jgi:hypothetical protein
MDVIEGDHPRGQPLSISWRLAGKMRHTAFSFYLQEIRNLPAGANTQTRI